MITPEARWCQLIPMLAAFLLRSRSARAYFDGFDGVDTHQGVGDIRIQPIEHRLPQSRRDTACDDRDTRTNRVSVTADLPHQLLELLDPSRIGTEERVLIGERRVHGIEAQRADLWRQAAHDLRGNLGVVANATVGLTHSDLREPVRDEFVRILMRNVTSLHHLLDDVTSLARLQAGREERRIEPLDVTPIMQQLCEGIRPLAQQRRLFLRCEGPPGFAADGDAIKIRRIAQNLILNAVKYTREGGIVIRWGDSVPGDPKRWELCVADTGPGLHTDSGRPLADALERGSVSESPPPESAPSTDAARLEDAASPTSAEADRALVSRAQPGEGIGLSIVKRLCDILDATIELRSEPDVGTSFRILFPRHYAL